MTNLKRTRKSENERVSIRAIEDEAAAVFAFLDATATRRGRAHWEWKYRLQRPGTPAGFCWYDDDGSIAGSIGLMPTTLHTSAQTIAAAWFVDWHVAAPKRGNGIGSQLLQRAEAEPGLLCTLHGSAQARRLLPHLGWHCALAPATWVLPLTARCVATWSQRRLPRWVQPLADPIGSSIAAYFRPQAPPPRADLALVDVERLPDSYDAVWQARAPEFAPLMQRGAVDLNWFCADDPDGGYSLRLLRQDGEVAGHLIWRIDVDAHGLRRGRIVDLLWPRARADIAEWLVANAAWRLQEAEADYVDIVVSVPDLGATVRRCRFIRSRPLRLWYHHLPPGTPPPDHWYITYFDCDRAYR